MEGIADGVDVKLMELVKKLLDGVVRWFHVSRGNHDELDLSVGDVAIHSVLLGRVQQPEVRILVVRWRVEAERGNPGSECQ